MAMRIIAVLAAAVVAAAAHGAAQRAPVKQPTASAPPLQLAQRRKTCKQVSSCEEAVILWCSGYKRADGDNDGIPCENVCPSKRLVDQIRRQIGC